MLQKFSSLIKHYLALKIHSAKLIWTWLLKSLFFMVVQLFFLLNHLTFGGKEDVCSEYCSRFFFFLPSFLWLHVFAESSWWVDFDTCTSYGSISQEFLKAMMVNILLYLPICICIIMHSMAKSWLSWYIPQSSFLASWARARWPTATLTENLKRIHFFSTRTLTDENHPRDNFDYFLMRRV